MEHIYLKKMQTTAVKSPLATLFAKLESCKDKDGYTLVEHIKEMFNRILLKPGDYPLDKFEDLSYLIKTTRLRLDPPMSDKAVNALTAPVTEQQEWIRRFLVQLRSVTAPCYLDIIGFGQRPIQAARCRA